MSAAYGDGAAWAAAVDLADDAVAAYAGAAGDAQPLQFARHDAGGAHLLEGQFRMWCGGPA